MDARAADDPTFLSRLTVAFILDAGPAPAVVAIVEGQRLGKSRRRRLRGAPRRCR
jgi:hypothetical protein